MRGFRLGQRLPNVRSYDGAVFGSRDTLQWDERVAAVAAGHATRKRRPVRQGLAYKLSLHTAQVNRRAERLRDAGFSFQSRGAWRTGDRIGA